MGVPFQCTAEAALARLGHCAGATPSAGRFPVRQLEYTTSTRLMIEHTIVAIVQLANVVVVHTMVI